MAQSVELEWQGETYLIPERETFEVAEQIEEVIDLADIERMQRNPKFTKLARCYGIMLRHAGAKVSDHEVHQEIIRGAISGDQKAQSALQAISLITFFLTSGMPIDDMQDEPEPDKKKGKNSSKRATKSRSKSSK